MSVALFLTTLFLLHGSRFFCIAAQPGKNNQTEIDRQALLHIRSRITDDPLGVMDSWTESTNLHYCKWNGIICDQTNQRVTVLNLTSSKLRGTLSPYVGNLSFLKALYFNRNKLSGIIPPEIGRLQKLRYLWLANNSIGGEIPPNISSCSNLGTIKIYGNKLEGEIPYWFGSMSNLRIILLQKNRLVGTIPSSLGNLTSLEVLQLQSNNLTGSVPQSLGKLLNLQYVSLDTNHLSGKVPPFIYNLSALEVLDLVDNHLEGELPLDFNPNLVSSLQFLSLSLNKFKGTIPPILLNFTNLETLEISSNELHGQVPFFNNLPKLTWFNININFFGNCKPGDLDFLSSLSNATVLEIGSNNFGGTFPKSICYFSQLIFLAMWENRLTGHISDCIGNLTQLQAFDADDNQFNGAIPSSMGKLHQLFFLDLSMNQLSCHIPLSIGNLTNLVKLALYRNNLEGHISYTLGNCTYLQLLDISQNNLSGTIPTQILSLSSLSSMLNLSNNHLTGSLPTEVGNLRNLGTLDISNNMISGEIPDTLGDCVTLEVLKMGNNLFEGSIPQTFSKLMGLTVLDLSMNNLTGNVPSYLVHFNLLQLNLSYNNLEGEVPTGKVFNNASGIFLYGNSRLCGGITELKLPHCDFKKTKKIGLQNKMKLVVAIIVGCCGITLVAFTSLYAYFTMKRKNKHTNEPEGPLLNISYQSLVRATNGFSFENLIGSGTFGVVYKGIIDEDQTVVAVKKFNLEHCSAFKSYVVECEALRHIRHRNLVKVITTCSSVDHQGNDFKALIYDYMVNGSLHEWLHPNLIRSYNRERNAPRTLNFHQRLCISVDVAFALEYLHHLCGSPIVHCDIKPSNVLLDDDMVAHVGDFGLAKFLSNDVNISNGLSSIGIRGTIGYAPPEYGVGNEVSTQGDVYSFGILLMEIFTGKKPTDEMFKDGMNLHKFVKTSLSEEVIEIIDESLLEELVDGHEMETRVARNSNRTIENSNRILEAIVSILEVAISCSVERRQERLDMSKASAKLSSIRNKFLETHSHRPGRNRQGTQK